MTDPKRPDDLFDQLHRALSDTVPDMTQLEKADMLRKELMEAGVDVDRVVREGRSLFDEWRRLHA